MGGRAFGRTRLLPGESEVPCPRPKPSWRRTCARHSQAPVPSLQDTLASSHAGPRRRAPKAKSLIQAQSSTPDWLCYRPPCPPVEVQAEVNSQPTAGDKVPKGCLLQRRASGARRSPPPLLRHSDSHSPSIQGCCGNCRLGQAPGAPSPPAAASPPVTLPVPTLGHSRTDPAARASLGLRQNSDKHGGRCMAPWGTHQGRVPIEGESPALLPQGHMV